MPVTSVPAGPKHKVSRQALPQQRARKATAVRLRDVSGSDTPSNANMMQLVQPNNHEVATGAVLSHGGSVQAWLKTTSAPSQFSDLRTACSFIADFSRGSGGSSSRLLLGACSKAEVLTGSLKGAGCLEADGLSGNRTSAALHHDKFANKTKADLDLHFPTLSLHCMRTCIIPAAKEAHPRTTPRCSRSIGRNRSFKTFGTSSCLILMGRSIGSTIKPASFCKEPLSLLPAAARLRQVLVLARHETSIKFYQKRQRFIQLVGDHWFYVLVVQKLVDLLSFAFVWGWQYFSAR